MNSEFQEKKKIIKQIIKCQLILINDKNELH